MNPYVGDGIHHEEESDEPVDDFDLVARAKKNDPAAVEMLVRRYHQKAYAVAYRTCKGDAEEARDLTQEAFLRAFRDLGKFKGKASFYTWLYRIVVNTCLDGMRRERRRKWLFSSLWSRKGGAEGSGESMDAYPGSGQEFDPLAALSQKETRKKVQGALQGLSDQQRTAFELKVFEEMSIAEIANILHVAEGTVKSHLFRATLHIRKALDDLADR